MSNEIKKPKMPLGNRIAWGLVAGALVIIGGLVGQYIIGPVFFP